MCDPNQRPIGLGEHEATGVVGNRDLLSVYMPMVGKAQQDRIIYHGTSALFPLLRVVHLPDFKSARTTRETAMPIARHYRPSLPHAEEALIPRDVNRFAMSGKHNPREIRIA